MAFASILYPGEKIIDDTNANQLAVDTIGPDGKARLRGRIPRDYTLEPFGALAFAQPFDIPLIPRSEWTVRIQQMEQTKTRLSDLLLRAGIPSKDQDGTNYCWANAPTTCIETLRCVNGDPYVPLSPASVAAPIKNFRNQGGWGGEALEYIVAHGIASTEFWPEAAIKKQYWTEEEKANAMLHIVTEWLELRSRNFDQLMTCLLLRIPVAIGLNWWSHEIAAIDPVVISTNKFGVRFRNSWSDSYGSKGFSILNESKATPDDAVAPLTTLPAMV